MIQDRLGHSSESWASPNTSILYVRKKQSDLLLTADWIGRVFIYGNAVELQLKDPARLPHSQTGMKHEIIHFSDPQLTSRFEAWLNETCLQAGHK